MGIIQKTVRACKRDGLWYVLTVGPGYVRNKLPARDDLAYEVYNPYGELSRAELLSHCRDRKQLWHYGSNQEVVVKPPLSSQIPKNFKHLVGTYQVNPSYVCEVENVRLLGDRALSRLEDGRFILEEMGKKSVMKPYVLDTYRGMSRWERLQRIVDPSIEESGIDEYDNILNLVPRHGAPVNNNVNYAHWLMEDLPRLRGYEYYTNQTTEEPTILLKQNPPSWMKETLRLLNVNESDWVEWNGKPARASRVTIPKLNYIHSNSQDFQPSDRNWVVDRIKSNIDLPDGGVKRRNLFVSRQGIGRRTIENFDEVADIVQEFDYEIIRPEELSFKQQVKKFHRARIIAGPFGAGLINMIFMKDGGVIDMFPQNSVDTIYYAIANEQQLAYDYIKGEPRVSEVENSRNEDILINPGTLNDVLERMEEAVRG